MTFTNRDTPGAGGEEPARICILDYGMGNLRSVEKALERVGATVTITAEIELAAGADGLVLPGVGAFPKAMARVRDLGLDRLIRERLEAGTPVLGICLGYQLVFESSTELGGSDGLALIGGNVVELDAPGLKVPHIGWEPVHWRRESELTEGIASGTPFYFVHGLAPRPAEGSDVLATAEHGSEFACAVARGSLYGVQFHPEKSSVAGLRLLSNFTRVCASTSVPRVRLYPAIDIRDGKAVRLVQGDYDRETVFDTDPVDAALRWAEQGARALHVVDLDGARAGAPVNLEQIARICEALDLPVQAGGGLRQAEDVNAVLDSGAAHAVLGTAAVSDPALAEALAAEHGERIVVSVDSRAGSVAVEGWERRTEIGAAALVADLAARGVRRFVHTPVEVDGTLGGPDLQELGALAEAAGSERAVLIYSGGVGTLDDLSRLAALDLPVLEGVIVGRALYEGSFSVAEGQAALDAGSSR